MLNSINERIRALRIKKGLSISELAGLIGVNSNTISEIEEGTIKPDIDLLVPLSDNLSASIDYLLRGKEYHINKAIGKLELCCKEDSVELLSKINKDVITFIDEDDNDIFYYIDKYDSVNIFSEILNKYSLKLLTDLANKEIDHLAIYSLLIKFDYLEELKALRFFIDSKDDPLAIFSKKNISIYDNGMMEIVMRNIKFKGKIFNMLFSMHENNYINPTTAWQSLYSVALEYAFRYERNEMGLYLAQLFIAINNKSIELYNANKDSIYQSRYSLVTKMRDKYERDSISYPLIGVSSGSIKGLLEHLYYDDAMKLYKINSDNDINLVPTGLFEQARLRLDGEDNKNKLFVTSCLDNGLISIEKLLTCNNFYLIKNALYTYPISPVEIKDKTIVSTINDKYLTKNGRLLTPDDVRRSLLDDLYPKLVNKDNEIMTEEYFISLLNDNNYDLLVIKLSVRLEAILKAKYKLEGTFEEMINEYIINNNIKEDKGELLHKLRRVRNSRVHAERGSFKLTREELGTLIELITKMSR